MKHDDRRAIGLWRLSVLGPLISARLEHGDRARLLADIATRTHRLPNGEHVRLSARTIEGWLYEYRRGGFDALLPKDRGDLGRSRAIASDTAELILRIKRERPRRSIRRIIKMLERAQHVRVGALTKSSVHRLLHVHRASARPLRGPATERRSFIHEHAGDLWVGDALHGPMTIAPDGKPRKAYLLSQIDCATRYIIHSYFDVSEGAAEQEYGLKEAILKHGIPRAYYVDRGAAYIASSLVMICAELGIQLLHAGVQDAEAKGVIERWHRTWREEVGDELPPEPLPLADLNAKHWAWLHAEYHARAHDTTQRAPRDHWLSDVDALRPLPRGKQIDEVFLHRERRVVRKDGTVRFHGQWLEVRPELVGREVELRFGPSDVDALPRVFVDDRFFCDTVLLDRLRNAFRKRRRVQGEPEPGAEPSGLHPLDLIEAEHYRRVRPVDEPARHITDNDEEE